MDDFFDSKQMIEFFQNTFTEEQPNCEHKEIDGYGYCVNCGEGISNRKHESTYIDDSGQCICTIFGLVFETLDFKNECNWYKEDPSRCNGWRVKPKVSARKVFDAHHDEYHRNQIPTYSQG